MAGTAARTFRALALLTMLALLGCEQSKMQCPAAIKQATRLILVTTPSFDDTSATLTTYERSSPEAAWTQASSPIAAVVGIDGLAWGHPFADQAKSDEPVKLEGDTRTPVGIYRVGVTFGFDEADRPGHLRLMPDEHYCVDDVGSPHYGRIVPKSVARDAVRGEDMATFPVYKRGLVIDYPPSREVRGGSCIFLHIWGGEGVGTAGCVALPEEQVLKLQTWAVKDRTAIAILPQNVLSRFKDCLPD